MQLSGLHFLLTYRCTFACDHCFVWGSPWQQGVLTIDAIRSILRQARQAGVTSVCFEGGEPFLYYATLLAAVTSARRMGFKVSIVTNSYWAISLPDALAWLRPLAGKLASLSVSSDLFHYNELLSRQAQYARAAAEKLGIPIGVISIVRPQDASAPTTVGELPDGLGGVMYRGRAAANLVAFASLQPWETFTACPHENLRDPGRVHVDAFGNLHLCQGVVMGNLFEQSLRTVCAQFDPDQDAIVGPLLRGGPAELARTYQAPHAAAYADACHLCFETRRALQSRFPRQLRPSQMYGEPQ